MLPRRLSTIVQMPEHRRDAALADGLELLAEHVVTLEADASSLAATRRHRSAAVLRCFAEEEAAKVLILLDLARAGWRDQAAVRLCLSYFYSHVSRGLYVQAYDGVPADLAEVRRYVDHLRQQFYLDGPMNADSIFGNEVLARREERLYVDYIEDEDGSRRWTGPADRAAMFDEPFKYPAPPSTVIPLVDAMSRIGLLTEEGIAATRRVWNGVIADDGMHWLDLRPLSVAILDELAGHGRTYTDADRAALSYVVDNWIFPLNGLDLTIAKVDRADLERERERWLASEIGIVDDFQGD
jgi:AbiV family abortive infection protein